ncbi:FecR family protein [Serratia liquefaciens]|uniref:FecR family protein n=1 Tax=Serratia liquefaciens TaxID=614 RepID=UPI00101EB04A|nr:FecR domain-containing protein [Serratia liquefaciens]RYM70457.1 hypothetical protein BSQ99_15125 [Serratia liquefaciens]
MSKLEDEAITWIVKLTSGDVSQSQIDDFTLWRNKSAYHEEALMKMRTLWIHLGNTEVIQNSQFISPKHNYSDIFANNFPLHTKKKKNNRLFSCALLVMFIFGCYHIWVQMRYDYLTGTGENKSFYLDDGSKIQLDTASAVNVNYTPLSRIIDLAKGQAYFEVTHNADRPFYVKTNAGLISVLGTVFSVREDGDRVKVVVSRGHVNVTNLAQQHVDILTGQEAILSKNTMKKNNIESIANAMSWTQGSLQFDNQKLSDILKEVQRYDKNIWFIMDDTQEIMSEKFTVRINIHDINNWLFSLQDMLNLSVVQYGPVIVIKIKN